MRFEELNWMDVESYVKQDDRVIIVLGATEQHGYLSVLADVQIPLALADAASQRAGVLVAPPLNFGCSPYFLSYPGTISLRASTFISVVEDLVRSLYQHGFRRMLVLNGHGGNNLAKTVLFELANELPGLRLGWYEWWLSTSLQPFFMRHELKPAHASWLESFPFTRVGALPDQGKAPLPAFTGLLNAPESREHYGDGNFGGPYQVADEIMQELFEICLEDVLHLLKFQAP